MKASQQPEKCSLLKKTSKKPLSAVEGTAVPTYAAMLDLITKRFSLFF